MPQLNELPVVETADVSNDDFLLLFDNSAATNKSRRVTRSNLLTDVARQGGNHNFGTSEIAALTATAATIIDLTVTTSLAFDSAATLLKMYRATGAIVTAGTAAGAAETLTFNIQGVAVGDYISISFSGPIPDGLMTQAWVSGANTVSVKFYNATSGAITGSSYSTKIVAMRFA